MKLAIRFAGTWSQKAQQEVNLCHRFNPVVDCDKVEDFLVFDINTEYVFDYLMGYAGMTFDECRELGDVELMVAVVQTVTAKPFEVEIAAALSQYDTITWSKDQSVDCKQFLKSSFGDMPRNSLTLSIR